MKYYITLIGTSGNYDYVSNASYGTSCRRGYLVGRTQLTEIYDNMGELNKLISQYGGTTISTGCFWETMLVTCLPTDTGHCTGPASWRFNSLSQNGNIYSEEVDSGSQSCYGLKYLNL